MERYSHSIRLLEQAADFDVANHLAKEFLLEALREEEKRLGELIPTADQDIQRQLKPILEKRRKLELELSVAAFLGARPDQVGRDFPKISAFLTQTWSEEKEEQYLGISEDGSADYRTLALQIRLIADDRQSLVFQLGHESFGTPSSERDDVELDWAFYEHQFSDMSMRVGRTPCLWASSASREAPVSPRCSTTTRGRGKICDLSR